MSLWESLFAHLQQPVAQILLTRNDIADVRNECQRENQRHMEANSRLANTISQRTEYVHRAFEHGGYPHSQRERYFGSLCG